MYDDSIPTKLMTRPTVKARYQRPGRPMKLGKYVYDPTTQSFGFYLGLCNNCNAKFIQPKEALPRIAVTIGKQQRHWKVRLLHWLEKRLAI